MLRGRQQAGEQVTCLSDTTHQTLDVRFGIYRQCLVWSIIVPSVVNVTNQFIASIKNPLESFRLGNTSCHVLAGRFHVSIQQFLQPLVNLFTIKVFQGSHSLDLGLGLGLGLDLDLELGLRLGLRLGLVSLGLHGIIKE